MLIPSASASSAPLYRAGLHAFFSGDAEADERADLGAELDGFIFRQVAEMLDFQFAVRVLVDGQRVDDAHGVARPQPFEFGDHLTVEVGVVEPEHDELHRSDCHAKFLLRPSARRVRPGPCLVAQRLLRLGDHLDHEEGAEAPSPAG